MLSFTFPPCLLKTWNHSLNHVNYIYAVKEENPPGDKRDAISNIGLMSLVWSVASFSLTLPWSAYSICWYQWFRFFFFWSLAGCYRGEKLKKKQHPTLWSVSEQKNETSHAIPGITWSFFLSFREAKKTAWKCDKCLYGLLKVSNLCEASLKPNTPKNRASKAPFDHIYY